MPLSNAQTRDMQALLHPFAPLKLLDQNGPLILERGQIETMAFKLADAIRQVA